MELLDLPMSHLHGAFRIKSRISASLVTLGPGKYSSPIVMFRSAQTCRVRLNVASATSTSVGYVSQFGSMTGSMTGATLVSVLVIVTLPRERVLLGRQRQSLSCAVNYLTNALCQHPSTVKSKAFHLRPIRREGL